MKRASAKCLHTGGFAILRAGSVCSSQSLFLSLISFCFFMTQLSGQIMAGNRGAVGKLSSPSNCLFSPPVASVHRLEAKPDITLKYTHVTEKRHLTNKDCLLLFFKEKKRKASTVVNPFQKTASENTTFLAASLPMPQVPPHCPSGACSCSNNVNWLTVLGY